MEELKITTTKKEETPMKKNACSICLLILTLLFPVISTAAQPLDRGGVVFTFDDGAASLFTKAYPIMHKYGIEGTAFVVGNWMGETNSFGTITFAQARTLQWNGWEIANHTDAHVHFCSMDDASIIASLVNNEKLLNNQSIEMSPGLAPPYGESYNQACPGLYTRMAMILEPLGFLYSRRAWTEDTPLNDPVTFDYYGINVLSIKNNVTSATVRSWIDKAISQKKVLVLVIHNVATIATDTYDTSVMTLENIAWYVDNKRSTGMLDVMTLQKASQKLEYHQNQQ